MEVYCHRFYPGIVGISWIVHIASVDLRGIINNSKFPRLLIVMNGIRLKAIQNTTRWVILGIQDREVMNIEVFAENKKRRSSLRYQRVFTNGSEMRMHWWSDHCRSTKDKPTNRLACQLDQIM